MSGRCSPGPHRPPLLAHADPIGHPLPDVQVLVADVRGLLGAPGLRGLRVPVVRHGGRGGGARDEAVAVPGAVFSGSPETKHVFFCCRIFMRSSAVMFGFFVAGYTGVLLSVTNHPIWSDTPLFGALFIVSAASTSAALMLLLARACGLYRVPAIVKLHRLDELDDRASSWWCWPPSSSRWGRSCAGGSRCLGASAYLFGGRRHGNAARHVVAAGLAARPEHHHPGGPRAARRLPPACRHRPFFRIGVT